ncbi:hypothetical protein [Sphaerisporangium aureirubrum]|uniref:Uncharacterized protein n=1 Tax=Sphaerisporangium aureirubrum TaxID=1544736 RepID=A0ABW1NCM6_9ACTN
MQQKVFGYAAVALWGLVGLNATAISIELADPDNWSAPLRAITCGAIALTTVWAIGRIVNAIELITTNQKESAELIAAAQRESAQRYTEGSKLVAEKIDTLATNLSDVTLRELFRTSYLQGQLDVLSTQYPT